MKKSKQKMWNSTNMIYAFAGLFLIVFLILLVFPEYSARGVTVLDFLLLLIFAVIVTRLGIVRASYKRYFDGPLEWKRPWLFTFLFVVTLALILAVEIFLKTI